MSANLELLASLACAAHKRHVELLLLPELFLQGYDIGAEQLGKTAVTIDGPEMARIQELAVTHELALCVPFAERGSDGLLYNSAVLVDRSGSVVSVYRKTHLWRCYESDIFTPGGEGQLRVVTLEPQGVRVGMIICFDVEFAEPARLLGLQGVELLCVPTALAVSESNLVIPRCVIPTRAIENVSFVAYSNFPQRHRTADESAQWPEAMTFCGLSCIVGPDGRELSRAEGSHTIMLVADLSARALVDYAERNPYFYERQPQLYGALAQQQAPSS